MFSDSGFKDQLRAELGAQGGGVSSGLAVDALAHGRRLRRRQRQVRVLGGTGAVTAVAVGAVVLSGQFGSGSGSGNRVGDRGTAVSPGVVGSTPGGVPGASPSGAGPTTPAPTSSVASGGSSSHPEASSLPTSLPSTPPGGFPAGSPTALYPAFPFPSLPAPSRPVPPVNGVPATVRADAALLTELLPGGKVIWAGGEITSANRAMTEVEVQWQVPDGIVEAQVTLSRFTAPVATADLCIDPGGSSTAKVVCSSGTVSDGSQVRILHTESTRSDGQIAKQTGVMLRRPDGTQVELTIGNGPFFGYMGRLTQVPIGDAAIYSIVSDPRWNTTMDAAFVQHADATVKLNGS